MFVCCDPTNPRKIYQANVFFQNQEKNLQFLQPTHYSHDSVNFYQKYGQKSIMYHVCIYKKKKRPTNPVFPVTTGKLFFFLGLRWLYYEDNLGMSNLIWLPRGALDWKKEMSHGCEFLSNFFVGLYCSHKYFFFCDLCCRLQWRG